MRQQVGTADTLRNSRRLEKGRDELKRWNLLVKLGSGEMGGEYLLDDEGVLWYAPKGEDAELAIPRVMIPGVLALVHSTLGHPGVARTTLLVRGKCNWPTLIKDMRGYVLSCGCRRRKRTSSQRVAMMPARFLRPWEVLEMDIQDLIQESQEGNRYLLVVVDRTSKFMFAHPLPSKDRRGKSQAVGTLLDLRGIDPERYWGRVHRVGGEVLIPVVESVDTLRSRQSPPCPGSGRKGGGGGSKRYRPNSASLGLGYGTDTYSPYTRSKASPRTLAYLRPLHHSAYCLAEMLARS